MAINGVIPPYSGVPVGLGPELQGTGPVKKDNALSTEFKEFVTKVDQLQKTSETLTAEFAQGRQNDIHGTMITAAEAGISLRLLGSMRNRVIEAYREIMRMSS
jgi:flagellar hook-basal body complex protein FliE